MQGPCDANKPLVVLCIPDEVLMRYNVKVGESGMYPPGRRIDFEEVKENSPSVPDETGHQLYKNEEKILHRELEGEVVLIYEPSPLRYEHQRTPQRVLELLNEMPDKFLQHHASETCRQHGSHLELFYVS